MRKIVSALAISVLLLAALSVTVFAHGHRGSVTAARTYTLCAVEDCNTVGYHLHNGTTYAGHYWGDGHDYHLVCGVQNCTEVYNHLHDGVACLPHSNADGHSYHSYGHGNGGCH